MIKVTKETINDCARNLMFELAPGQDELILEDFASVLAQIDFLKSIPGVDKAEPMTFPYREHQRWMREDKPEKPLSSKVALGNSKTRLGNQVKLPKVVGNKNDQMDE